MGQGGRKHDRGWELAKQEASRCNKNLATKIKTSKTKKKGTNGNVILNSLSCFDNFLGCFAQDELEKLVITNFPCFIIVNLDSSDMNGSHWIAIGIFRDYVEIFDPLGFNIFSWTRFPCFLLAFHHRLSIRRKVLVSKCLQSDQSLLCGIYCCLYVYLRSVHTWNFIQSRFVAEVEQNDKILPSLF